MRDVYLFSYFVGLLSVPSGTSLWEEKNRRKPRSNIIFYVKLVIAALQVRKNDQEMNNQVAMNLGNALNKI